MESERLRIFDGGHQELGTASREEVHKHGYWHETFHCWLLKREENTDYIYFQIRSRTKKDFPSLLDITAAGHLLADETAEDGIREVNEELGLNVMIEDVHPLGVIKDRIELAGFIDREFAHVYVYKTEENIDFALQKAEVSGIIRAPFAHFQSLCLGFTDSIDVEGFCVGEAGHREVVKRKVSKQDFVPHSEMYWRRVAEVIACSCKEQPK